MNKSRRIGALVSATAAAVGMASLVAPATAQAAPRGPQPVTNFVQSVRADTATWVSVRWQTDRRVCNAAVTVSGRKVDVDYPGSRRSTSFSKGDSLRPGRNDFTSFKVNADFDRSGVALLRATISYDLCGRHARTVRKAFGLAMPVVVRGGDNHGGGNGGDNHGGGNGGGHGSGGGKGDNHGGDNHGGGNNNGGGNDNGGGHGSGGQGGHGGTKAPR